MPFLTPAPDMPWPVSAPFRMRPGLSRLAGSVAPPRSPDAAPLFLRDAQADAYAGHKRRVLAQHRQRAQLGHPDPAVLAAVAQAYAAQTGVQLAPGSDALAEGLQEDFVILHDEVADDVATLRARFLSVCFPSNWAPAEKLGLDFTAIHAPVADSALLQAGAGGIVDLAFRQASMQRHVWLLTPGADLSQHPETRRIRWEDALQQADAAGGALVDQVFFRVERQTTLPLPDLKRAVFFIRVMVCPLARVLAMDPLRAGALHDALASMSDAVVAYRGMAAVRPRLLAELSGTGGRAAGA